MILSSRIRMGGFVTSTTANTQSVVTSSTIQSGSLPQYPTRAFYTAYSFSMAVPKECNFLVDNSILRIYSDATNEKVYVRWLEYIE